MNRKEYNELLEYDFKENTLQEIQKLGLLIDFSGLFKDESGVVKSIEICYKKLEKLISGTQEYGIICYFLGNAYANLKIIKNKNNWESETEIEKQIKYYKKSLHNKLHLDMKCQILTNLGNLYDNLGQTIKSIHYRQETLKINPKFTMALGTLGCTLKKYSCLVYDESHKLILIKKSYELLKNVDLIKEDIHCYPEAREGFKKHKIEIEEYFSKDFLNEKIDYKNYFKNISMEEKKYRKWCLKNKLFINPLNDISVDESCIAQDILSVPSIIAKIGDGPYFHSMFNQIKQEYVSARYLFFEGIEGEKSHYSDKDNLIYNTFDSSEYSFNLEKIKIAYKTVYSLFDKISYILNIYFDLGIDYRQVNFRKIWRVAKEKIIAKENYILVGLYHISKEVYNTYSDEECVDDEYKNLDKIRNFLEHKHIRIKSLNIPSMFNEPKEFAYDISKDEMIEKTYSVFSLIRESIIYLSLSIYMEEKKKEKKGIFPMVIEPYFDEEKI